MLADLPQVPLQPQPHDVNGQGGPHTGAATLKKLNGRKRHIAVDTLGLPVLITVTTADTTDRDAARELLWRLRVMQPQVTQAPPTPASSPTGQTTSSA
ncbi:transposase [Streptomyces ambofaciens]